MPLKRGKMRQCVILGLSGRKRHPIEILDTKFLAEKFSVV